MNRKVNSFLLCRWNTANIYAVIFVSILQTSCVVVQMHINTPGLPLTRNKVSRWEEWEFRHISSTCSNFLRAFTNETCYRRCRILGKPCLPYIAVRWEILQGETESGAKAWRRINTPARFSFYDSTQWAFTAPNVNLESSPVAYVFWVHQGSAATGNYSRLSHFHRRSHVLWPTKIGLPSEVVSVAIPISKLIRFRDTF